jgi:hypothetical protein
MSHTIVGVVVLASLASSLVASAQTAPDFSGTWTMDASQSVSAVQNEPVRSKSLDIAQTPAQVTIERTTNGRTFTTVYKAGSVSGRTADLEPPFNGIWYMDGAKLVTETAGNVSDKTVRTREVYSLDPAGGELTVETLLVVEHGYAMRGAQNHASGKDVYKRSAPH